MPITVTEKSSFTRTSEGVYRTHGTVSHNESKNLWLISFKIQDGERDLHPGQKRISIITPPRKYTFHIISRSKEIYR